VPRAAIAKYFVNKECFRVTDQEFNALVMRLIMQTNACIFFDETGGETPTDYIKIKRTSLVQYNTQNQETKKGR
jgi:hypothetical protein